MLRRALRLGDARLALGLLELHHAVDRVLLHVGQRLGLGHEHRARRVLDHVVAH